MNYHAFIRFLINEPGVVLVAVMLIFLLVKLLVTRKGR